MSRHDPIRAVVSQSQEALSALVCGYGKANRDAAVMVMFKAYFDDSCSDEGSKIMLLAGCVQSYKVWANLSFAWEAALAQEPSIKHFHMIESSEWSVNEQRTNRAKEL